MFTPAYIKQGRSAELAAAALSAFFLEFEYDAADTRTLFPDWLLGNTLVCLAGLVAAETFLPAAGSVTKGVRRGGRAALKNLTLKAIE